MEINSQLLEQLLQEALSSERLRVSFDLRTTPDDQSQRMLNALQPGTVLPIHRHPMTSETLVILNGCLDEVFFDDEGHETQRMHIDAAQGVYGCNIPRGTWHTIEVLEPTVIIEAKDGPYSPMASEFFDTTN